MSGFKKRHTMAAQVLIAENSYVEMAFEQNSQKGQDRPFEGTTLSGKRYFGVFDGHGSNSVISELTKYIINGELAECMDESSPIHAVQNKLNNRKVCGKFECSGATMNFGILHGNTLTVMNCGDSRMIVFKNGELIYISDEHGCDNLKEKERLAPYAKFTKSSGIKAISETEIIGIHGEYIQTPNGLMAVTQALGHDNNLAPAPDIHVIHFDSSDEIVAVSFTDGVSDMLIYEMENMDEIRPEDIRMIYELSAEELKTRILERWLQPWDMTPLNTPTMNGVRFNKNDCDDIGIARMVIRPKA